MNKKSKNCKNCNVLFKLNHGNQVFCSHPCLSIFNNKRHLQIIKCGYCNKIFKQNNIQHYLCSSFCRINYYKQKKQKKIKCVKCKSDFIKKSHMKQCFLCIEKIKYKKSLKQPRRKKTICVTTCEVCNISFINLTQRKTCSKLCLNKLNGLKHKGQRWKMNPEGRKKISVGRKKFLSDPKNLKKHSLNVKKTWLNKKTREKRLTIKRNQKISEVQKKQYADGTRTPPVIRKKKHQYKNIFLRSTWEVKVAKWLDANNIKWEYESKKCRFKLKTGNIYIVDFYLPDLDKHIEVKGWWSKKSKNKCEEFVQSNGYDSLLIIDEHNINDISLDKFYYEYTDEFNFAVERQIEYLRCGL